MVARGKRLEETKDLVSENLHNQLLKSVQQWNEGPQGREQGMGTSLSITVCIYRYT